MRSFIPTELAQLTNLGANPFVGPIVGTHTKSWLTVVFVLESLGLSSNALAGRIPSELGMLTTLSKNAHGYIFSSPPCFRV